MRAPAPPTIILARIVEPNRGDTMSRYGLVQAIRRVMPEARLAAVTLRAANELNTHVIPFPPGTGRNLIPCPAERRLLREGNCVVLWTCGHDYTDDGSALKALHVLLRCAITRYLYGAPFFIVAQGAGPVKRRVSRWSIRGLGAAAAYISLRDPESLALFKGIVRGKGQGKLHLTTDSALLSTLSDDQDEGARAPSEGPPIIGINLRRWFHLNFHLLPHEWRVRLGLSPRPETLDVPMKRIVGHFARFADHCVERYGARVRFLPMYPPGRQAWEIDERLSGLVKEQMRHGDAASVYCEDAGPRALLAEFRQLSAMVGVRLHSTIVATACHVPSLHITYSPKGSSYYALLGEEAYQISIHEVAVPSGDGLLIERFDRLWAERDAYRQRLCRTIPRLQDQALEPVRALARWCGLERDGARG
jgi:polysaccharide pyruvyl transferase WcaK-like protein